MSKVEEKYHRAAQSSHLEMRRTDEGQGDVETIIAAGLADAMGILLTRLRGEWDAQRGNVQAYRRAYELDMALANDEAAKAKHGPTREQFFRYHAEREALTERMLILQGLRSLEPAKQALFLFAHRQAPHKACESDEAALGKLVGQVLDVWLDKLCHPCEGRGFSGGYGSPRIRCTKCSGTGSRRQGKLGANAAEQAFGLWMLNVMDSRCNGSMKTVQRKTRQG